MLVSEFLQPHYHSGPPDTKLFDIMKRWVKDKCNVFLVEDDEKRIIGILTLYDVLKKLLPFYLQLDDILSEFAFTEMLTPEQVKKCMSLTAGDIMCDKVVSIEPDANFLKAATEMFSFGFDYIPVIDSGGKCHGLVTRQSLEEAILSLIENHLD
ncbi:MAG: CBS domain-containing protein [Patescibacteria group bacterium]|nr:CBS domain-containing protein [Patescibacteria group bacterium]